MITKIDEEHIQYTLEDIDDLVEVLKQVEELRVVDIKLNKMIDKIK